MPLHRASRRLVRVGILAVTMLALALSATPAVAASKAPTQVRKWSAKTASAAPGSTVKYTVKVTSRGKASKKRLVILQQYKGGRWVKVTQARSSKHGNATLRMKVARTAGTTHRLRVRVQPTRKAKARATAAKKVAVRASSATARQILAAVNKARSSSRKCGGTTYPAQPPLTLDARLDAAAQGHARDMADHDYFDHRDRNGGHVGDRVTRQGYVWGTVAENIAAGQRTVEHVMNDWLESPGHCANIMSGRYKHLGVGMATNESSYYGIYWVQNFAAPRS